MKSYRLPALQIPQKVFQRVSRVRTFACLPIKNSPEHQLREHPIFPDIIWVIRVGFVAMFARVRKDGRPILSCMSINCMMCAVESKLRAAVAPACSSVHDLGHCVVKGSGSSEVGCGKNCPSDDP